jgi:hypothetical protein
MCRYTSYVLFCDLNCGAVDPDVLGSMPPTLSRSAPGEVPETQTAQTRKQPINYQQKMAQAQNKQQINNTRLPKQENQTHNQQEQVAQARKLANNDPSIYLLVFSFRPPFLVNCVFSFCDWAIFLVNYLFGFLLGPFFLLIICLDSCLCHRFLLNNCLFSCLSHEVVELVCGPGVCCLVGSPGLISYPPPGSVEKK